MGFGGEADRFAERRMGVDRLGEVAGGAAHFDGEDGFGNQFAGVAPTMPQPRIAVGRRVDDPAW